MKIKNRINLSFFIVFLVVITGSASLVLINVRNTIIKLQLNQLQSVANMEVENVNNFLDAEKDKVRTAATHSELTNKELRNIRDINSEFYEVFVLNSEGIIISSSDESKIGLDRSTDKYFINARDGAYVKGFYRSEITGREGITVSTPYARGVLVARIDLESLNKIISNREGLGETGEILLAQKDENGDAVYFSERKFRETAGALAKISKESLSVPITQALLKKKSVLTGVYDYRNEKVIAATGYIEEMDWGLVAKIDEKESFQVIDRLVYVFLSAVLFSIFIFYFISLWIARKITKPIDALSQGAEAIKKGNLGYKVEISSNDEMGNLANVFNEMTDKLVKTNKNIEKKVMERTKDLEKINKYLTGRELKMLQLKKEILELKNSKE